MKTMFVLFVAAVALFAVGVSSAQSNNMMDGYGGIGWPLLLLIVVVGFAAWFAKRGDK